MNKKILLGAILVLVLVTIFSYFYSPKTWKGQNTPYIVAMTGHITDVEDGMITVSGIVVDKTRLIKVAITSDTILRKSVIVISEDQIKSGKSFAPEIGVFVGKSTDLTENMLVRIKTMENLLGDSPAKAVEIEYTTYDLPY